MKNLTTPVFKRGDVAKILNVNKLTIANREKRGQYPSPNRNISNYRVYTLDDVFSLQLITNGSIDPKPIISLLYDRGYRDMKQVGRMIDEALAQRRGLR